MEDEVSYSSSTGDEDFASERISRENFFFIGANANYSRTVWVNMRHITWKTIFSYLIINNFMRKMTDAYLRLQKSLVYIFKMFMLT